MEIWVRGSQALLVAGWQLSFGLEEVVCDVTLSSNLASSTSATTNATKRSLTRRERTSSELPVVYSVYESVALFGRGCMVLTYCTASRIAASISVPTGELVPVSELKPTSNTV